MTRRSDGPVGEDAGDAVGSGSGAVDPRFDPAFQRSGPPDGAPADVRPARSAVTPEPAAEPSVRSVDVTGTDVHGVDVRGADVPGPGARDGVVIARWLAPVLWILAVAFPAAGLALRAAAIGITGSMPYSSFGEPLGQRWLLDLAPLLTVLAPGFVAGGPVAVIAALVVHAVRRPRRRPPA